MAKRASGDWIVDGIAVLVAGMWALTGVVGLVRNDYTAMTIATPVMLIVVGAVVGWRGAKKADE